MLLKPHVKKVRFCPSDHCQVFESGWVLSSSIQVNMLELRLHKSVLLLGSRDGCEVCVVLSTVALRFRPLY